LRRTAQKHRDELSEKDRIITELSAKIDSLGIAHEEKADLQDMISSLVSIEQPKLLKMARRR